MSINRKLGDLANVLDDGTEGQVLSFNASGAIAASTISTESTLGTLTQSFDSNQTSSIALSSAVNTVPYVSVFKEVPQVGFSSKGQWDVNSNATNYDFYDEKPISYSSATLTPSATGDGTFTNSAAVTSAYDISSPSNLKTWATAASPAENIGSAMLGSDGTKGFYLDHGNDQVVYITLSTAFDISTATRQGAFSMTSSDGARALYIFGDGTRVFTASPSGDYIRRYDLSTPWDVNSVTQFGIFYQVAQESGMNGLEFKPDGTKMYVCGTATNAAYQYSLSTAWDITTASYDNKSLSVSDVGTSAMDLRFNSDGTKLFSMRNTGQILTYNLSTPWDISTGSYSSSETWVTGYTNVWGFSFANNGTKILISNYGAQPDELVMYDTGSITAFSSSDVGKKVVGNSGSAIITATSGTYQSITPFADTSAISSWQLFGAQGKSDGSGIELSGYSTQADIVFPTGASGSGASMVYSNNVSPTTSALNNLRNVVFNNEGTIALVMTSGNIQRWNLSTAFDLSTMTEASGDNFSSQLNTTQYGLAVSPDGTKLFVGDHGSDLIKQFTLSTPWSPSTESYNGYYYLNNGGNWNSFSGADGVPSTTNFNPFSIQFNSDGTKMITIMFDNVPYHSVVEFALSTGFDMSTMSYTSFANFDGNVDPEAIAISPDGLKIMMHGYNLGQGGTEVYSLPSAFSVGNSGNSLTKTSGAIDIASLTGSTDAISYGGFQMSSDGKRMWAISAPSNKFYEITGGTTSVHPYSTYSPALTSSSNGQINSSSWLDINSMTADETKNGGDIFYAVSTDNRTSWGVAKGSDGVRKIARNNSGTWQYNNHAGTAIGFGISTPSYDNKSFAFTTQDAAPYDVQFNNNGTKMYMVGGVNNTVFQYTLSTAYDVSTASYDSVSYSVLAQDSFNLAIAFNNNGTKMYLVGSSNDDIFQYTLSTAYDVSTASYDSVSLAFPSNDSYPQSISFNSDGTKMYAIGTGNDRINQWTLSTAYDISTAGGLTYLGVVNEDNIPQDFRFNSDGTKLFLLGNQFDYIFQYTLSTAYDVSTASYDSVSYSLTGTPNPRTFLWNNDGTKFYILSTDNDTIYQYTSSSMLYDTSETWVNGTNNNEHATLQEALTSQSFNRMNKAQLDAVADGYHFSQDSADTLDLMIAPYATSGTSPISDGVTINYDAASKYKQAINGTEYDVEFTTLSSIDLTSKISANLKVRVL